SRSYPDDGVQPAIGHPRRPVVPDDHAVRRRALPQFHVTGLPGDRIQMPRRAGGLCRVPYPSVGRRCHIVRVRACRYGALAQHVRNWCGRAALRREDEDRSEDHYRESYPAHDPPLRHSAPARPRDGAFFLPNGLATSSANASRPSRSSRSSHCSITRWSPAPCNALRWSVSWAGVPTSTPRLRDSSRERPRSSSLRRTSASSRPNTNPVIIERRTDDGLWPRAVNRSSRRRLRRAKLLGVLMVAFQSVEYWDA